MIRKKGKTGGTINKWKKENEKVRQNKILERMSEPVAAPLLCKHLTAKLKFSRNVKTVPIVCSAVLVVNRSCFFLETNDSMANSLKAPVAVP